MRVVLILTATLLLLVGCQQKDAAPAVAWGVVDESLSPEQRSRQDALARLFKTIQSGTDIRHIKSYEPDIDFQEPSARFFETGIQLSRWDWLRPPQGDKLFVRLDFLLDEPPGDKFVTYERTYAVSRSGGKFVIRRVDSNGSL